MLIAFQIILMVILVVGTIGLIGSGIEKERKELLALDFAAILALTFTFWIK